MRNRDGAIDAVKKIFDKPDNFLLFDTETTGFRNDAQIIELGVIDMSGKVVADRRFKPTVEIDPGASQVNGIYAVDLEDAPAFPTFIEEWETIVRGKTLIAYNLKFDGRMLTQTYEAFGKRRSSLRGICLMELAKVWRGYNSKLGGGHTAVNDCLTALKLMHEMKNSST